MKNKTNKNFKYPKNKKSIPRRRNRVTEERSQRLECDMDTRLWKRQKDPPQDLWRE